MTSGERRWCDKEDEGARTAECASPPALNERIGEAIESPPYWREGRFTIYERKGVGAGGVGETRRRRILSAKRGFL